MKFTANASGSINSRPFRLSGVGDLDLNEGTVFGQYEVQEISPGVDSLLFNCVLVTGYPSVCRSHEGAYNPFQQGSYSYLRHISFEGGGNIDYRADCVCDDARTTLRSTFEVTAELPTTPLEACLPVFETWTPRADQLIDGDFSIAWRRKDGGELRARARTTYVPPKSSLPLEAIHRRSIVLINERPTSSSFVVRQRSDLSQGDIGSLQL